MRMSTSAAGSAYRLVRQQGTFALRDVLPNQSNLLVEYVLHNLSDADFTFTGSAMLQAQELLAAFAPKFGYDPKERAEYNIKYRNPVLAYLSAKRLQIIYASAGLNAAPTRSRSSRPWGLSKLI